MYFVYILTSQKDGSRYIGITTDVRRRLEEHNRGGAVYTAAHAPYVLEWYSGFLNKAAAYDFERYLKSGSGHAFMNKHLLS
jgi:predicted GIY-YIG superfamily endonuclease